MISTSRHKGYPDVSLADARIKAKAARAKIEQGVDPIVERKLARLALLASQKPVLTFDMAADEFMTSKKLAEFRNVKHAKQWQATIMTYASPIIGAKAVDQIVLSDILDVLKPIWGTKNETASRLRARIEAVLSWATVSGHRSGDNPARWAGNLKEMLPSPGKTTKVEGHPALAIDDVPAWFMRLRQRDGMGARALEFLVLVAGRSGEIRGATWNEIDMVEKIWTIPAARMKADREHRVPLTTAAINILDRLNRYSDCPFVFPSVRGKQMSDMTLSAVMRRMHETDVVADKKGWLDPRSGKPAVPHGIRSSFKDWASDRTDYPSDMSEVALAHKVGTQVEQAYRRGDMMGKRRLMMEEWARFVLGASQSA
ncbi:MAG: site-specific integrase [Rhodobacterales bacterium]|nr:site-specific integrase [Rhodobacterales bacterium]